MRKFQNAESKVLSNFVLATVTLIFPAFTSATSSGRRAIPELDRRLRQSFEGDAPKFQRPVEMEVHGAAGGPLTLIVRDELGHVVQLDSAKPLARAEKQPLTPERLREQLGRLGGTPFKLGELKNHLEGEVLLPVSELNRLRREAVAELEKLRAQPKRWTLNSGLGSARLGFGEKRAFVHAQTRRPDTRPNAHRPRPQSCRNSKPR